MSTQNIRLDAGKMQARRKQFNIGPANQFLSPSVRFSIPLFSSLPFSSPLYTPFLPLEVGPLKYS